MANRGYGSPPAYELYNKKCTSYVGVNHVENLYTHFVLFLDYIEPNYVQFGAANRTVCSLLPKGDRILAAQEILSI
jgi:hypothetical protein